MKRRSSLDAGFDTYLSRELHQLYDPVLGEAIPDEIAARSGASLPRPDDDDENNGGGGDPDGAPAGGKGLDRGARARPPARGGGGTASGQRRESGWRG
jgi:hypothetical protein